MILVDIICVCGEGVGWWRRAPDLGVSSWDRHGASQTLIDSWCLRVIVSESLRAPGSCGDST